jgi:hypothetical protein
MTINPESASATQNTSDAYDELFKHLAAPPTGVDDPREKARQNANNSLMGLAEQARERKELRS